MREEGGKDGEEIGEWRGKEGKNEGKGKEERKEGKEGGNRRRLWEGGMKRKMVNIPFVHPWKYKITSLQFSKSGSGTSRD